MIHNKKEKRTEKLVNIPTRLITLGENPIRESFDERELARLADSIKRHGLIQPLRVKALSGSGGATVYELVSGRRRLRACKLLCIPTVACIVSDHDEKNALEAALCENLVRSDLDMFEQADAISNLMRISQLTASGVAEHLSVSESFVSKKLGLLAFQKHERQLVLYAGLDQEQALNLAKTQSAEKRLRILNAVIEGKADAFEAQAEKKPLAEPEPKQQIKSVLKDKRIFLNTVERAVTTLRAGGVSVDFEKNETATGDTVITIRLP